MATATRERRRAQEVGSGTSAVTPRPSLFTRATFHVGSEVAEFALDRLDLSVQGVGDAFADVALDGEAHP